MSEASSEHCSDCNQPIYACECEGMHDVCVYCRQPLIDDELAIGRESVSNVIVSAMVRGSDMSKLRSLPFRVAYTDTRPVKPPPPDTDPAYSTPEFQRFRAIVIARAGGRCEAIVDGQRCTKAKPAHRVYADHIVELRDGGSLSDPANGQCLCRSHHELKTVAARRQRQLRGGGQT